MAFCGHVVGIDGGIAYLRMDWHDNEDAGTVLYRVHFADAASKGGTAATERLRHEGPGAGGTVVGRHDWSVFYEPVPV